MSWLPDRLAAVLENYGLRQGLAISERMERIRRYDGVVGPLKAGQKAPAFALPDQDGNIVRLADILARGPLIVSFFRGAWCPYCNEEMAALVDAYPEIRRAGAEVVAVTPQSAAYARAYRDEHRIPFPILVDADFSVEVSFGVLLHLPTPARFIIAMDGTIADVYATAVESSSTTQQHAPREKGERLRRFGDVLRRCRLTIPVDAKALGTFVRLPSRVGKAVTQEEFAEAIGVTRSWIGLLESNRPVRPSVALLDRICDVLALNERQRLAFFELAYLDSGGARSSLVVELFSKHPRECAYSRAS